VIELREIMENDVAEQVCGSEGNTGLSQFNLAIRSPRAWHANTVNVGTWEILEGLTGS
jgi:hypothetical protein